MTPPASFWKGGRARPPGCARGAYPQPRRQGRRLLQKTSPHPLLRRMGGSTIDWIVHGSLYLVLSKGCRSWEICWSMGDPWGFQSMKQFLASTCWSRGLILREWCFVFGNLRSRICWGCAGGFSNGAGRRGFSCRTSTLDSPLSVAKIYNKFDRPSRGFVKFYVFHKGKSFTSGENHKGPGLPPGFFLVLSGLSWYDTLVYTLV